MATKKVLVVFFLLFLFFGFSSLLSFLRVSLSTFRLNPLATVAYLPELLPLRLCMAFIFFWYSLGHLASGLEFNGIGNKALQKFGVTKTIDFTTAAKVFGILEFMVGISYVVGVYLEIFSFVASATLFMIIIVYYVGNKVFLFRDIAIFGSALSLFLLSLR